VSDDTRYDIGDTYQLTLDTTQKTATVPVHVDAVTVSVTITAPDGTPTTGTLAGAEVVRTGLGAYIYEGTVAQLGTYTYVWTAAGVLAGKPWTVVEASQFYVNSPGLRIISLAEAKKALRYPATDNGDDDDEIADMVDAATATIESLTGPMIPRVVTQKLTTKCGVLQQWPVLGLVTLDGGVDTSAVTFTDDEARDIGVYESTLTVPAVLVYRVGRTPTPPVIRQAARELIRHRWQGGRQRPAQVPGTILTANDYDARSDKAGTEYGIPFALLDQLRDFRRLRDAG
jgi:hypothetical protein